MQAECGSLQSVSSPTENSQFHSDQTFIFFLAIKLLSRLKSAPTSPWEQRILKTVIQESKVAPQNLFLCLVSLHYVAGKAQV